MQFNVLCLILILHEILKFIYRVVSKYVHDAVHRYRDAVHRYRDVSLQLIFITLLQSFEIGLVLILVVFCY